MSVDLELITGLKKLLHKHPEISINQNTYPWSNHWYYSIYVSNFTRRYSKKEVETIEMARIWIERDELVMALDSRFVPTDGAYILSEMNTMHRLPYCKYIIDLHKFDPNEFVKILIKSYRNYDSPLMPPWYIKLFNWIKDRYDVIWSPKS